MSTKSKGLQADSVRKGMDDRNAGDYQPHPYDSGCIRDFPKYDNPDERDEHDSNS